MERKKTQREVRTIGEDPRFRLHEMAKELRDLINEENIPLVAVAEALSSLGIIDLDNPVKRSDLEPHGSGQTMLFYKGVKELGWDELPPQGPIGPGPYGAGS